MWQQRKKSCSSNGHNNNKNANEPILYKRERNKINSLAWVLQIENVLYADQIAMRYGRYPISK
jgi:hypothetical protein